MLVVSTDWAVVLNMASVRAEQGGSHVVGSVSDMCVAVPVDVRRVVAHTRLVSHTGVDSLIALFGLTSAMGMLMGVGSFKG
jgi:hypothetical protein